MIGENTGLEELLSEGKEVVFCGAGAGADGQFLLEVDEAACTRGVFAQPIGGSGAVKPGYFKQCSEIVSDSFYILMRGSSGYTCFVALSHAGMHASLGGDPKGILLRIAGTAGGSIPALLVLRGQNPFQTVKDAMGRALELTGGRGRLVEEKLPAPKWFELLGWESGPSLGGGVSHEGILSAIQSLQAAGTSPGYVIIEEGWQDLENGALASFKADAVRFPEGLKGVVQDLHRMGIKHVGVWHGIMGARSGIAASLASQYDLPSDGNGRCYLGSDLGRTFQFYHDYYDGLHAQGITFTRVGDQTSIRTYVDSEADATQMMKNLQSAIQAASSIEFDSFHFNADSVFNGNIFYWANSRVASTAAPMTDEYPLSVYRSVRDNLSCSLWLQYLMQPVFDSWMSDSPHSELLAVFHALSGSLNIVSDRAGSHNVPLLKKMLLPSGRLLQADQILTLCVDSVFIDPLEVKQLFKAYTRKGESGIIAAFNVCSLRRTLNGFVSPTDVPGLAGDLFAVHSHLKGYIGVVDGGGAIPIALKPGEADVLTFSPVRHNVAVFGCHSFFIVPGVLADVDIEEDSVHVTMMVAGPLLLYAEKQVLEVRRNGHIVPWEQDSRRKTLSIDSNAPIVEMHATFTILFES